MADKANASEVEAADTHEDEEDEQSKLEKMGLIPWIVIAFGIWLLFGFAPFVILQTSMFTGSDTERLSQVGSMFGAASAFFSGFALVGILIGSWAQRSTLKQQRKATAKTLRLQRQALNLQSALAMMERTSSDEFRRAQQLLAEYENQGEISRFRELRNRGKERTPEEEQEYQTLDAARRKFVHVFHNLANLATQDLVDDQTVRAVVAPSMVFTLLFIDEPMEEAIRSNYDHTTFEYFQGLYPPGLVIKQWSRTEENPLTKRLKESTFLESTGTDAPH